MQNIHVKRYQTPGVWAGTVEPEDRSWIVFLASDGEATFWRRVEVTEPEGHTEHAYIDAELPQGVARVLEGMPTIGPMSPAPSPLPHPGPLDFELIPAHGDGNNPNVVPNPDAEGPPDGWYARLNARAVMCWGPTEHDAIRSLMNYVAQLCTAGCMDHTGAPVPGTNPRRYHAVFGEHPEEPLPVATPV